MEQLRLRTFEPKKFPNTESFIWQLQADFIRFTDLPCPLPDGSVEDQARAMLAHFESVGALEVLDGG